MGKLLLSFKAKAIVRIKTKKFITFEIVISKFQYRVILLLLIWLTYFKNSRIIVTNIISYCQENKQIQLGPFVFIFSR